ncbi:hypothetical protein [Geobacter sp. AOG1]|uniref:hypothetical protein n=1 Tax=Geobacter sp. AOG1 TaxID=1566346 RepID=UPI001CC76EC3|nr:hypothetical protein [Geobacter sp. AOG1]GFE56265.1 hypothetical protein AOG1_01430 [Geobacter sp. AOG1]
MKTLRLHVAAASIAAVLAAGVCTAAEHPGTEVDKPNAEHPGKAVEKTTGEHPSKPVTAKFIKKSIKEHVKAQSKATGGIFMIHDDKLNKEWKLKLDKIHDPVRMFEKDGKMTYFTCSDFKSTEGKDVLDIDFWMVLKGDKLEVTDTKIHKVNGEPRYTYEGTELKEIK